MNRRHVILAGLGTAWLAGTAQARPTRIEVYKSPTCGCCAAWGEHMTRAGFDIRAHDVDPETLGSIKRRAGITPDLRSCHTGFVDGYFIEGHVPATDVQRLRAERPDARGLSVPGMPIGSPGMEMGSQRDAFDTLLVLRDGATEVFQRHA